MPKTWVLRYNLDGAYARSVWQTQEGAIAHREQLLKAKRMKIRGQWKVVHPLGWTAITSAGTIPRGEENA